MIHSILYLHLTSHMEVNNSLRNLTSQLSQPSSHPKWRRLILPTLHPDNLRASGVPSRRGTVKCLTCFTFPLSRASVWVRSSSSATFVGLCRIDCYQEYCHLIGSWCILYSWKIQTSSSLCVFTLVTLFPNPPLPTKYNFSTWFECGPADPHLPPLKWVKLTISWVHEFTCHQNRGPNLQ